MTSPIPDAVATWLSKRRSIGTDIILAGKVFGGRLGEAPQQPRDYQFDGQALTIWFQPTEVLRVENPSGFKRDKDGGLIIPSASRVTFGWHYYGRPRIPENWCEEIYEALPGNLVRLTRTGPLMPGMEEFPYNGKAFVELV